MEEKFDMWALVELMGHNKIAGRVTEHKFGNQSMLRIDVPAVGDIQAFTKIVAVGSIYAINPLTEQSATDYAAHLKASPLEVWDMNSILEGRINSLLKVGKLLQPEIPVIDQGENDDPF